MKQVLHPSYFPSIAHFVAFAKENYILEKCDNYQKQTYRNRMYIYGANGKQALSIPVKHTEKNGKQLYKDVKIENNFHWQKQHWKSIETAYRTSPFFEFYEDEIAPLYEKQFDFLYDFNLKSIEVAMDCLQLEFEPEFTQKYRPETESEEDLRALVVAKAEPHIELTPYTQVFDSKHDFINNLSILDLLCNEGTNALTYLEEQKF